jgi:hypothetical protein
MKRRPGSMELGLFFWGWYVLIMAIGIASLYIEPQHVLTVAKVGFISLLVTIDQTLWYARRI